jgi:hypothetical protein
LLEGNPEAARPKWVQLLDTAPADPYYHYYLGCADLLLAEESDAPSIRIQQALGELEQASLTAGILPLRDRVGKALSFTRGMVAEKDERPRKEPKGFQVRFEF